MAQTLDYNLGRAAEILRNILYITIASVSEDGKPWNSPVYSAFDKELNFYWASDKNARHSKNIRATGEVFLVIYDSTMPEGTGEGVYIQASAYELQENEEITVARRATQGRKSADISENEYEKFSGDAIRRVYKAVPEKIWMNDVENDNNGNYIRDIRIEIPTGEIIKRL